MSSRSAKTHQLGRQCWTSFRDSLDFWVWHVPTRASQRSLAGFGIAHSLAAGANGGGLPASRPFLAGSRKFFAPNAVTTRSFRTAAGKISPNNVRRSCTSGGLLLLGLSSPSNSSSSVVATCTAAADTALAGPTTQKASISLLTRQAWLQTPPPYQKPPHAGLLFNTRHSKAGSSSSISIRLGGGVRYKSSARRRNKSTSSRPKGPHNNGQRGGHAPDADPRQRPPAERWDRTATTRPLPPPQRPPAPENEETLANSMSKYLQSHLSMIPPRPTKEEFLAAATGFWQRMKARFKWHSIRSMRPWNVDEWGAFVSWVMLGHIVWVLVGTTTFVSLLIITINTVFAQEELAKWVGDYLTQSAGVTVVFESAIVPKWKGGVISFRNVFLSRRPGQVKSSVMKGSSTNAAAIAAARHTHDQPETAAEAEEHDDGNYTQYDVTINSVDVTLSFIKWWNGKGLLKDVEVKGVRGVIDRTHVQWSDGPLDPFSFRHTHHPGDFEIERFKLEDLMVTVHQPNGFRPFSISIFSCELPQLRKQWLFYDFLSANHVSGSYDGSLFTIHPRQVQRPMHNTGMTPAAAIASDVVDNSHHNINNPINDPMSMESPLAWKKFSRLRIDGLKIDHLNRGDRGPFGWIYEGNVDIVSDVMFPAETNASIAKVMSDFYDRMEEAVTSNRYIRILEGQYSGAFGKVDPVNVDLDGSFHGLSDTQDQLGANESQEPPAVSATVPTGTHSEAAPPVPEGPLPQYVIMDMRLHLNDVRAAVPFFPASDSLGETRAQSYVNAALIRPIVAYINAKRTYIPISCRLVKHLSDWDGSWSIYDCGLMDDSSAEVYAAFARDVEDQHSRVRRLKKVGFWTLSMVVQALLAGVAGDLM